MKKEVLLGAGILAAVAGLGFYLYTATAEAQPQYEVRQRVMVTGWPQVFIIQERYKMDSWWRYVVVSEDQLVRLEVTEDRLTPA